MKDIVSVLYHQALPDELFWQLKEALAGRQVQVFFRADDIGKVDGKFIRMMGLFWKYQMPLCLAVVPEWMSKECWQSMDRFFPDDLLWCWHQHGYAHINHEIKGKKNEFGESRTEDEVRRDLQAGREDLAAVLEKTFCPVFTPPWNRCSRSTLQLLTELGFWAVSRSDGVQPEANLPDLCVNVDLHTVKEGEQSKAIARLLGDWRQGIEKGYLGIMLHHQRMNDYSFILLERLFQILQDRKGVSLSTFRELL